MLVCTSVPIMRLQVLDLSVGVAFCPRFQPEENSQAGAIRRGVGNQLLSGTLSATLNLYLHSACWISFIVLEWISSTWFSFFVKWIMWQWGKCGSGGEWRVIWRELLNSLLAHTTVLAISAECSPSEPSGQNSRTLCWKSHPEGWSQCAAHMFWML